MAYLNERPIAQGEVTFFAVTDDHFDGAAFDETPHEGGFYIVAHSESGHHHVLEMDRATVSTVRQDSAGMTILRVMVEKPGTEIVNRNPNGHANLPIQPRLYEARISREVGMDDAIRASRD